MAPKHIDIEFRPVADFQCRLVQHLEGIRACEAQQSPRRSMLLFILQYDLRAKVHSFY